jgi:O-antigen ligase
MKSAAVVQPSVARTLGPLGAAVQRGLTLLYTFGLSALATTEPMYVAAHDDFNPVRQGAWLLALILLHLLTRPWLLFTRELILYIFFDAYMWLTLIWTSSVEEAMNTLLPSLDYILLSILFGSLVAFHNLRAVLTGALAGFTVGAALYALATGFPFHYPDALSYNAIAGMYLMGLCLALFFGWYTHSSLFPIAVSLVAMVHIAATTSIKTNLGIVIGAAAAAIVYIRNFLRVLRRSLIFLVIFASAIVYVVINNEGLTEQVGYGLDRVSRGVEILQSREDVKGNTSFGERTDWKDQGIKGWIRSPLFGNGVESFRTDYGITSHSTPIDLLYNFGVIGFGLFYAIFGSIVWRLMTLKSKSLGSLPALIFAGTVCYLFMTLSGTMEYNTGVAVFVSVSAALLGRFDLTRPGSTESPQS